MEISTYLVGYLVLFATLGVPLLSAIDRSRSL